MKCIIKNNYCGVKLLQLIKDLNQTYNIGFDIILYEQEETSIYESAELNNVIGTVGQKMYREFKVIDYRIINDVIYYLLTNKQGIVGWVHLNESLTIYRKSLEPIKVLNSSFTINEINKKIRLDIEKINVNKIYMSKSFVILNGEVLEGIYAKNTLVGFLNPKDLDHSKKINEKIDVSKINSFYMDSGFLIKAEEIKNKGEMLVIDYFPIIKIARLKYDGNILWAKLVDFTHNKLNRERESLSEMSYSNLLAIHMANSFKDEREKSKRIIKELVKENQKLLETINESGNLKSNYGEASVQNNDSTYKELYDNLKTSKLGKIQIAYWKYLRRRRYK